MEPSSIEPARPLRVMVVDADERTRQSLTGLLGIGRRCIVVGSAGAPSSALELAGSLRPDVVVLDPRLPEIDGGLAVIAQLRQVLPSVRVLVMSRVETGEAASRDLGADAIVRKTFRAQELLDAVLAACGRLPA